MINKVLIVIDPQIDFTTGALYNLDAIKTIPVIKQVLEHARNDDSFLIIFTKDTHSESYLDTQEGKKLPVVHCVKDTEGWKVYPDLAPLINEKVICKPSFGYDDWKRVWELHNKLTEVWICGFCTDICVVSNFMCIKAAYPELPIKVIHNACAGVTQERHLEALHVIKYCQGDIVEWKGDHYEDCEI